MLFESGVVRWHSCSVFCDVVSLDCILVLCCVTHSGDMVERLRFSGSSDPAVLAQTSSVESKRQNYIHELINTEETYMADMSIVLDVRLITPPYTPTPPPPPSHHPHPNKRLTKRPWSLCMMVLTVFITMWSFVLSLPAWIYLRVPVINHVHSMQEISLRFGINIQLRIFFLPVYILHILCEMNTSILHLYRN